MLLMFYIFIGFLLMKYNRNQSSIFNNTITSRLLTQYQLELNKISLCGNSPVSFDFLLLQEHLKFSTKFTMLQNRFYRNKNNSRKAEHTSWFPFTATFRAIPGNVPFFPTLEACTTLQKQVICLWQTFPQFSHIIPYALICGMHNYIPTTLP